MALNKSVNTTFGSDGSPVVATYWKIMARQDAYVDGMNRINVLVAGYASEDARRNKGQPMMTMRFGLTLPEGKTFDQITRTDLYAMLKSAVPLSRGPRIGRPVPFDGATDA